LKKDYACFLEPSSRVLSGPT